MGVETGPLTESGYTQLANLGTSFVDLPRHQDKLFDHEAFWIDSLIMALTAKSFTRRFLPGQEEASFTVALLSDLALPVLLSSWEEYYAPILDEWKGGTRRLSEIERENFSWDHGQAGAWIVKSWNCNEEMVCYIGAHNLEFEEIKNCGLDDTIALPISLASNAGSVQKPDPERPTLLVNDAIEALNMTPRVLIDAVHEIRKDFHEIRTLFELPERNADRIFDDLIQAAEDRGDSS